MRLVTIFENVCDRLRSLFAHAGAALLVPVILLVWRLILESPADPDLFARIGMGRLVEKLGAVPLQDPFAFTAKLPIWIDHEWFSGVIFYEIVSRFGDAGLVLLKLMAAVWTCLLLTRASLLYTPHALGRTLWVSICALDASFLWVSTIRCQIFTYFFIAITYYGFVQYRVNSIGRYLLLIPLTSVALVNMHGGYALQVVALWLLSAASLVQGKRWKLLAVVAMLSSLAPALTPYGFETFSNYLVHAVTMERASIPEWAPLYRDIVPFVRTLLIVVPLLTGIVLALRNRHRDLTALVLLGFSFYCGFSHVRFVGFAMLTALVFGPAYFGRTLELLRDKLGSRLMRVERSFAAVSAFLLSVMVVQIVEAATRTESWRLNVREYPVQALEWLRNSGGSGKLLVDFNNGSFALWRLYPRFLISMDGRYEEVYTNQSLQEVAAALSPHTPEGLKALQKIAPTHILFQESPLARKAQASLSPEWRQVYHDEKYSIYTTDLTQPAAKLPTVTEPDLWAPLF
jgi:hypothetical protein